jgi:hypothetical protein
VGEKLYSWGHGLASNVPPPAEYEDGDIARFWWDVAAHDGPWSTVVYVGTPKEMPVPALRPYGWNKPFPATVPYPGTDACPRCLYHHGDCVCHLHPRTQEEMDRLDEAAKMYEGP